MNKCLKRHFHHGAGIAGTIVGVAAVRRIVAAAGGGTSCADISRGLATLGGGNMLGGITVASCIPVAAGLVGLGIGDEVKRAIWG